MPPPTTIPLTPGGLPPGYCFPGTWQQFLIDIFTGAYGTIPGSLGIGFNYGPDIPGVDDANKPWIRTDVSGGDLGTWTFGYGRWTKKHPIPAGPNDWRGLWIGTEADLWTFDGGDGIDPSVTPPTQVTGSFYEVDHAFDFRTLVGAGTLPIAGTILAPGDTGGLDRVKLSLQEMFPHTHTPQAEEQTGKPVNKAWGSDPSGSGTGTVYPSNHGLASIGTSEVPINTTLANAGGDTSVTPPVDSKPHENMPPYLVGFYYRRTARVFYTVP